MFITVYLIFASFPRSGDSSACVFLVGSVLISYTAVGRAWDSRSHPPGKQERQKGPRTQPNQTNRANSISFFTVYLLKSLKEEQKEKLLNRRPGRELEVEGGDVYSS